MRSKFVVLGCVVLAGLGCDLLEEDPAKTEKSSEKDAPAAASGAKPGEDPVAKDAPEAPAPKADVELGGLERRPAASPLDQAGRPKKGPVRGAVSWTPPAHWTARRDSGKPFILGEYGLTGHTDERPALCRLISSSSWSSKKTDIEQATNEAKRTRLRDEEGKSLLSKLTPTIETVGQHKWHVIFAEGRYRAPDIGGSKDPKDMLGGYAQMNFIPEVEGVTLALRCWAPADVMKAEKSAMRAWAASVQYPAKG